MKHGIFLFALVVSVGATNDSMLRDNDYGAGVEEYDADADYFGDYDEDYQVTTPKFEPSETTGHVTETTETIATITVSPAHGSSETPNGSHVRYPNGTLYDDYDCSKFRFPGFSGAPRGSGPACVTICVCLLATALYDAFKNKSFK